MAYPEDHAPCHIHGFYGEIEVIVDLREKQREVARADRINAIRPGNANRSDVRHVLQVAAAHFDELLKLWEKAHA